MMKLWMKSVIIFISIFFLSGCLYPQEERAENQVPYPDQLTTVQHAIDQYLEQHQVLPILTKDADVPLYEKYVIDFNKLIPLFISRPPSSSFQEGGVFLYVLVDVEENPQVKLLDLRLTRRVTDLQMRVNHYLQKHQFLPVKEIVDRGYFLLDYEKLGMSSGTQVESPYSRQYLPFIVDQNGRVGIDYRLDLYQVLQEDETILPEEGEDIRHLLMQDSFFAPAHSFPYTINKNGEPILK